MKKYTYMTLLILLVLSLTGCGSKVDSSAPIEGAAAYAEPTESIMSEETEHATEYADGDTDFGRLPEDDSASLDEMEFEESEGYAEELESEIIDDIHCRVEDNGFGYITVYISGTGTVHEEDFEDYSYIPAKVVVEEGISGIGDDVFSGCINLETIILPEGLNSIGNNAFAGCQSLETVALPESLESVGKSAFAGCQENLLDDLQYISINESNIHLRVDGDTLYLSGSGTVQKGDFGEYKPINVVVEKGITGIGASSFSDYRSLISITLPEGVEYIGTNAFRECDNLTSIVMPEGLKSIGGGAFYDCDNLISVTLPDSVATIGSWAFYNCDNLTLTPEALPADLKSIGEKAFLDCRSLTLTSLPDKLKFVDSWAFSECVGLKSIVFPESLRTIGYEAFQGCKNLTLITLPEGLEIIEGLAFNDTSLTSVVIPDSVKVIGEKAFNYCSGLTEATVGRGVEELGENVFASNPTLTKIRVPKSMQDELIKSGTDVSLVEWY